MQSTRIRQRSLAWAGLALLLSLLGDADAAFAETPNAVIAGSEALGIPGVVVANVLAVARNLAGEAAAVVRLRRGNGGVTEGTDVVLLVPDAAGNLRPALREGDSLDGLAVGEEFTSLHQTETATVLISRLGNEKNILRIGRDGGIERLAAPGDLVSRNEGVTRLIALGSDPRLRVTAQGHVEFVGTLPLRGDARLVADGGLLRTVVATSDTISTSTAASHLVRSVFDERARAELDALSSAWQEEPRNP